jgi:hypothetical protein
VGPTVAYSNLADQRERLKDLRMSIIRATAMYPEHLEVMATEPDAKSLPISRSSTNR